MPYNEKLADRIRESLQTMKHVEEKKMFRGLTFMVNGKMCISVSGERLMCRFDPALQDIVAEKRGFEPMIMKGKTYKGFCYVNEYGFGSKKDFDYWVQLCIDFNARAKASRKTGKAKR